MALKLSVGIMIGGALLCCVSDHFLGTQYLGNTFFQPFPHLILLLSAFCSLVFWYKERRSKAQKSVPPKERSLFDKGILALTFLLGWVIICFCIEYFEHIMGWI